MSGSTGEDPYRFLFDQHVNGRSLRQLRKRGVDVLHVAEVGLAEADDADIFVWAMRESRLVVTRNYRDFVPLVQSHASHGGSDRDSPGVLFDPTSIRESDVGGHVRALERWIERAEAIGGNPARNGYEWLG